MMWRNLTPLLFGFTIASLSAAPLPGGFDHSGWYEFEVVVLVDSQADVLNSETWPLLPRPGYPSRWRWLVERAPKLPEPLPHTHALVRRSLSGHTMIFEPPPAPARWQPSDQVLTEGDLDLIDELIELGLGSTRADRAPSLSEDALESLEQSETPTADLLLPFEVNTPDTTSAPLLSLESLVLEGSPGRLEQQINVPFAPPEQLTELLPITVSATAIPLPSAFEQLPLNALAPGLQRYRRGHNDEVIAAAAWLQGPGSENLPIMLEPETSSGYPRAQGFVQLVPSQNSWRLGLNFWANTDGQYLPDIFEMDPPPPSPPRRTRVPATSAGQPPTPTTGSEYPMQPSNSMMINAVPDVGKGLEGSANQSGEANGPPGQSDLEHGVEGDYTPPRPPEWPWRHVIHVADTVPLTENRLRYYDHPVIKVLAIWRELSWYELYVRGVARRDAERAAIDD